MGGRETKGSSRSFARHGSSAFVNTTGVLVVISVLAHKHGVVIGRWCRT